MTFDEWFAGHEWWKENSRRVMFSAEWELLEERGVPGEKIAGVFDNIVAGMRDEYGD